MPLQTRNGVVLAQQAPAATPAAGDIALYAKTDGRLYTKNPAGVEVGVAALNGADLAVDTAGATEAAPRRMAFLPIFTASNQAAKVELGNASEGMQSAFARRLQVFSFHGVEVIGGAGVSSAPAFVAGSGSSDPSYTVRVRGAAAQVGLRVNHEVASPTGNLIEALSGGVNRFTVGPLGDTTAPNLPSVRKVTVDQAITSTTVVNVTDMSFPVAANTAYSFRFRLIITSAATTTGWLVGLTAPASPVHFIAENSYQSSATTRVLGTLQAPGNFPLVTAAYAATPTRIIIDVEGSITNGTTAGAVQLVLASEVSGSAITVLRGSTREVI